MPAYLISEVSEVLDAAKMEEYRTLAQAAIEQYGGRYIVRGGAWEAIEGAWALDRVIVVEFGSVEQAKTWYRSPEYAKALEVSGVALKRRMLLVEGTHRLEATSPKAPESKNYLNPLAMAHLVVGGVGYIISFLPVLYIVMGIFFVASASGSGANGNFPPFFGWMFIIMGLLAILVGLCFSTCILGNGLLLRRRKRYWVCFALACVECILTPFGTILGVLTIVALSSDSAKAEFPGMRSAK
jgi:uncharacterized protein (DUF1330 family)